MSRQGLLSEESLKETLRAVLSDYLGSFLQRNNQNKCSEELLTGIADIILPKLMTALDPWIPKEEKKEEVK